MLKIQPGEENGNTPSLEYYANESQLLRRHEEAKPPIESYLFIPTETQLVKYNEKNRNKTLRFIFEQKHKHFLPFEDYKLSELEEEIIKYNKKNPKEAFNVPKDYKECEKRRLLQATGFNCAKTIQIMKENIRWRKELIPPKISNKVIQLLNSGYMYIHGRDINYRPIIVLNADIYMKLKDKYSFDDWVQTVIYFMEYTIEHLLIPGQVENWDIITDVRGVSLIFLPADLKKMMGIMQSNYRARLFANYIIGMGMLLRGIWKMIKGMLEEATVNKIRILEDSTMDQIFEFINHEQVEAKYGGKANDIQPGSNTYFPPNMPSKNYLKKDTNKETHLINERQYKELYTENKLTVTSQFYLTKWREEDLLKLPEKNSEVSPKFKPQKENLIIDMIDLNSASGLSSQLDGVSIHNLRMTKIQMKINNYKEINHVEDEFSNSNRLKLNDFKRKVTRAHSKRSDRLQMGKNMCDKSPDILPFRENSFFFDRKTNSQITHIEDDFKSKEFNSSLNFHPVSKSKHFRNKSFNTVNEYLIPEFQTNNINTNNYNTKIKTYDNTTIDKKEIKAFCGSEGCLIF